jgi:hypothetical protein
LIFSIGLWACLHQKGWNRAPPAFVNLCCGRHFRARPLLPLKPHLSRQRPLEASCTLSKLRRHQRISPPQSREAAKIPVRRAQIAPMFHCQCSQLRIRDHRSACLASQHHFPQVKEVPFPRSQDPNTGMRLPARNYAHYLFTASPHAGQFRMNGNAQKRTYALPGNPDQILPGQQLLWLNAGLPMPEGLVIICIKKKDCVDHPHLLAF